jgi:dolichol-phosphate mannosyltransferase
MHVMELTFILPVINERDNVRVLIPRLRAFADSEHAEHEVIVVDGGSSDGTREAAEELGAQVVPEGRRGYAGALSTGFAQARGNFVVTLDADLSHEPDYVEAMWKERERADVVIASRYIGGGHSNKLPSRDLLSRVLNAALRAALPIGVRDLSSGFRLYRRAVIANLELQSRNFEVLEEILVVAYLRGYRLAEIPFTYMPRGSGRSHARLIRFGIDLARTAVRLRKALRESERRQIPR